MDQIKPILLDVQQRLGSEVPELAYVDKDWGQLSYEKPPVKWPCALLDVKNVTFTQEGRGVQMADTQIIVTVANMRLVASSLAAPKAEDAYRIIELLDRIHAALHLFTAGAYSPLFRTNLRKVVADSSKECYEMTYQTAFEVGFDMGSTTAPPPKVKLTLK